MAQIKDLNTFNTLMLEGKFLEAEKLANAIWEKCESHEREFWRSQGNVAYNAFIIQRYSPPLPNNKVVQ